MKKIICGFVKHEELKCTDSKHNQRTNGSTSDDAGGIFYDEMKIEDDLGLRSSMCCTIGLKVSIS